jgi:hypothetical protein
MTTPRGLHRARAVRNNNQFRRWNSQAKANGAAIARPFVADKTWRNE